VKPRRMLRRVTLRAPASVATTSTCAGQPTMPSVVGGPGGALVSGRDACFAHSEMASPSKNVAPTMAIPSHLSRWRAITSRMMGSVGETEGGSETGIGPGPGAGAPKSGGTSAWGTVGAGSGGGTSGSLIGRAASSTTIARRSRARYTGGGLSGA